MKKKIQNKLGTYLAVTAGVGCASSVANAAVVFYGNASNPNIQADPVGVTFGSTRGYMYRFVSTVGGGGAAAGPVGGGVTIFTRGADLTPFDDYYGIVNRALYFQRFDGFMYGAVSGDQNYANMSFNGPDMEFEAVAQFFFDGTGGGYLIAIATTNAIPNPQNLSGVGGPALSISAGKAMIDSSSVSAVPEPSSHLALLAHGTVGLLTRRRLKRAA